MKVTEIDIKNCFPRIVYALNGMELPNDFYGEDRAKNKKKINTVLNSFRYDNTKYRSKEQKRGDSTRNLLAVGIDERCVNWLLDFFFECPFKSDFFNFLAYHESCIIGAARELIGNDDTQLIRRHDSIVVFDAINYKRLNEFDYLDQKGWFDSYEVEEFNEDFFEFM